MDTAIRQQTQSKGRDSGLALAGGILGTIILLVLTGLGVLVAMKH
jgi:threonine/homoserine/homoserine lactone efflux protein